MSACVVSELHISTILRYANKGQDLNDEFTLVQIKRSGELLLQQNRRSVNHRYDSADSNYPPFQFDKSAQVPSTMEVLKLLDCVEYQSCETDDYFSTPAYALLARIRSLAIRALPGYQEAPWAVD